MSSEKFHFIVVDDSKLDCFIAEKVIQKEDRNLSYNAFLSGKEALDFILENPFADNYRTVLLIDIHMPEVNGFDFMEKFQEVVPDDKRQQIVTAMLSSSINETDMARAKSYSSINKMLVKPLTINSFQEFLDNL